MAEYSSDQDYYTQLLPQSTHKINDSEDENKGALCVEGQGGKFGLRTVSTFSLKGIRIFAGSQQKFCDVCGL
jgi:hypothetical protein